MFQAFQKRNFKQRTRSNNLPALSVHGVMTSKLFLDIISNIQSLNY